MIERIKGIASDYDGYILNVLTYDYDEETDEFYNVDTTFHEFDTVEELEAYCEEHDLAVDTDGRPYVMSRHSDGWLLEINAEPAHQLDPINY